MIQMFRDFDYENKPVVDIVNEMIIDAINKMNEIEDSFSIKNR